MTKAEMRKIAIAYIEYRANDYDWDDLSDFAHGRVLEVINDEDLLQIGSFIDYAKVTVDLD
jgi:hypothetical protein